MDTKTLINKGGMDSQVNVGVGRVTSSVSVLADVMRSDAVQMFVHKHEKSDLLRFACKVFA